MTSKYVYICFRFPLIRHKKFKIFISLFELIVETKSKEKRTNTPTIYSIICYEYNNCMTFFCTHTLRDRFKR